MVLTDRTKPGFASVFRLNVSISNLSKVVCCFLSLSFSLLNLYLSSFIFCFYEFTFSIDKLKPWSFSLSHPDDHMFMVMIPCGLKYDVIITRAVIDVMNQI